MVENTINNDMTMGGATGTLLAGRYRVVRQLGQGGMGSVWLAEDTKLDGFKVAIKMLPSVLVNNRRAYAQVKSEALVSLKLSHPNIVTVRAFEEEGGSPFLVMDYIDGQTLDDYLAEKGKLTEEETVKLLKPVAAALDYAHTQGVVHRDVKPGNVMIRKDGMPFVLDFGIAREIQETMTRVTGKLSSGTLLYMSPEQLNGNAPKPAQDIYSFAAMSYECLKGVPPFSRGQIEYQIVNNKPEPLGPQFANCGQGVMAGLAKSPEVRPTTCAAVLKGGMRSVASTAFASRTRGWMVGVLLALVAFGGVGGWLWHDKVKTDALTERDGVGWWRQKEQGKTARIDAPRPGDTKTITLPGGATMELVWCPPGSFMMGSPDIEDGRLANEQQHHVTLTRGFWIGKYEVTQAQWKSVMGMVDAHIRFNGDERPVEPVSWDDCQKFLNKAGNGLRLPTDAEWEYACRAGSVTPYAGTGRLDEMGWYADNSGGVTHSVGKKKPNAWGLYDMHGNVQEWCQDWHANLPGNDVKDPRGPVSGEGRIVRGGCCDFFARFCRSACRFGQKPFIGHHFMGFRVACHEGNQ